MIKPLRPVRRGAPPKLGKFANHSHPLVRVMWQAIIERGVTLRSVANAAGLDTSTLHKWRKSPKGATLQQMDDVLGVLGYELVIQRKVDFGD